MGRGVKEALYCHSAAIKTNIFIEESRNRPLQESLCYILDRVQEWSSSIRLKDDVSLLALELGVDS